MNPLWADSDAGFLSEADWIREAAAEVMGVSLFMVSKLDFSRGVVLLLYSARKFSDTTPDITPYRKSSDTTPYEWDCARRRRGSCHGDTIVDRGYVDCEEGNCKEECCGILRDRCAHV